MSYCSVLHIDRCIYVLKKVLHADSQTLADALQGGKRWILHSSLYMTNIGRVNVATKCKVFDTKSFLFAGFTDSFTNLYGKF